MKFSNSSYSRISSYFAIFFSLYSWFLLFISNSILWIIHGLTLILIISIIYSGITRIRSLLIVRKSLTPLVDISIYSSSFFFFITSSYGFYHFVDNSYIRDKSILFVPLLSVTLMFAGVSLGICQRK